MKNKKIISFSLYGDNKKYTLGCVKNVELAKLYFKDWIVRVYYNTTVPEDIIKKLKKPNTEIIDTKENKKFINSLWRFKPLEELDVDFFISRDCDSRLSERDFAAVSEWIESGKDFHIIRDHPIGHGWPINAGMWGSKGGSFLNYTQSLNDYLKLHEKGAPNFPNGTRPIPEDDKAIDQCFLRDVIYPIAQKNSLIHDEYYNYEGNCVKIKRDRKIDNFAFIGESILEDDSPNGDQRTPIIQRYYN